MGKIALESGARVYLDANILIYVIEDLDGFGSLLRPLFERFDSGDLIAITSELSLAEVMVKPIRESHIEAQTRYVELFALDGVLNVIPITREILISAAEHRAHNRMKLPDAIHAATAASAMAAVFVTNDHRLPDLKTFRVLLPADLVP